MAKVKDTAEERGRRRWAQLIAFDAPQARVLESLRYRDHDHHVRSGAILGFSGLIIASDLVQFSADPQTIAYLAPSSPWLPVARVGLLALLGSSALSIMSIAMGLKRYSDEPWTALEQFSRLIDRRAWTETIAIWLCVGGSMASLASLITRLFSIEI
jgi:hypothetical protein